jgi:hypothetical protein
VANFPGSSENHSLNPSGLPGLSFLRTRLVRAEGKESCAPLKRWAYFFLETRTMVTTPAHLRSIVDHDGAVILDIQHNAVTPLNSTGAYIWQRLEQGMLVDDIVAQLARATNTEIEIVAADVDRFLEKLKSRHLLTHD